MNMRLVKILADGNYMKGEYQFNWNGTNESGIKSPPGIYFYTVMTPEYSATKKLMLIY